MAYFKNLDTAIEVAKKELQRNVVFIRTKNAVVFDDAVDYIDSEWKSDWDEIYGEPMGLPLADMSNDNAHEFFKSRKGEQIIAFIDKNGRLLFFSESKEIPSVFYNKKTDDNNTKILYSR